MNSFRSKSIGWRNESYRHYLASKGVRTNHKYYYTPTYVAGDLPLIAGDAVGTAGAAAVSVIPVVIPLALIYGGAVYLKKKKKKTGSYFVEKFNPMRPVDTKEVPEGSQWWAERKWDGTRMRMDVQDDKVDLINRRQNEKTVQFPDLQVGKQVRGNVVLDGEVIVPWGKTGESFQLLSKREHTKDGEKISELSKEHPARFIAFDILEASGRNLMSKPFTERKAMLQKVIRQDSRIREVQTTPRTREFTENMRRSGAEGVVFKDKNSPYREGRKTREWRKLKFKKEADVEIMGYEKGEGKRAGLIGALQTKKGKIGTGFTDEENRKLKKLLDAGKHPIVRVEYRNVGSKGAYREPVYMGLRSDIKKIEAN